MKARVNLTIEQDILSKAKKYAAEMGSSVSELVENYLRTIYKVKKTESLVDYIDKLIVPEIDKNIDFKKQYYKERDKKYGL
ncbi:hypothetical protein D9M68_599010 [compost metagenome]